ncbi:MAG: hypothetical protein FJX75_20120 [Armatimonadetes bacterium]|nr:hypothetical protein [Armatimonadota bacterium]
MDAIEDTEMAIEAYESRHCGTGKGALYVATYGLLQAMVVQQDAARHLLTALGEDVDLPSLPQLVKVRDIRNRAVGHPTKRDRQRAASYHFISRDSLSYEGFELTSWPAPRHKETEPVHTHECIRGQRKAIVGILSKAEAALRRLAKPGKGEQP